MAVIVVIISVLFALIGACAASFINAAALRRATGESISKGRSKCPGCGATLLWFELIPVISWLLVMGKCCACDIPIPKRYIIVELIGAFASLMVFLVFGLTLMTPFAFGVVVILLAVALIDLTTMEIPNMLVIALIPFAAASFFLQPEISWLERVIGFFIANLPMLILAFVVGGFGGGDIKLMAVCGFMLGWQATVTAFFIGVVTGGCFAIFLKFFKKMKRGTPIPFGPHLCIGIVASLFFGQEIISWYLGLIPR